MDDLKQGEQVLVNGAPPFQNMLCAMAGTVKGCVTDASGLCTLDFGTVFPSQPVVVCTALEAGDTAPVVFKVQKWSQDGAGNYIGCTVQAKRLRTLPVAIALLSALVGYDVTEAAAAVEFSRLAILRLT